jgi:hypothetical protein
MFYVGRCGLVAFLQMIYTASWSHTLAFFTGIPAISKNIIFDELQICELFDCSCIRTVMDTE